MDLKKVQSAPSLAPLAGLLGRQLLELDDPLGLQLEERLLRGQPHVVHPLNKVNNSFDILK